jgi:DNA-binding FadR family transcriptional regulator
MTPQREAIGLESIPANGAARVHLVKAPDLVAEDLRRRIAHGEFAEGDELPMGVALLDRYGISRPTLREAMHILLAEQLVVPSPTNRGGFRVKLPAADVAARYAGLLLQARGATLGDVQRALLLLEPSLARRMVARATPEVVARLREALEREREALGDPVAFAAAVLAFRSEVVSCSGSLTLSTLVQLLDEILAAHVRIRVREEVAADNADRRCRRAHRGHLRFLELVEAGDADGAEKHWLAHVEQVGHALLERGDSDMTLDLFGETLSEGASEPARDAPGAQQTAHIAADLRHRIAVGELAEGSALPREVDLRARYGGVARTVLREAMRILESEGLLVVRRGARGGAVVHRPTTARAAGYVGLLLQTRATPFADFVEARTVLEPAVAALAAVHRTEADLAALEAQVAREETEFARPGAYARSAVGFHALVARATGSPTLATLTELLNALLVRAAEVRPIGTDPDRLSHSHAAHAELLELIRARDDVAARALWTVHSEPEAWSDGGNPVDLYR